MTYTYNSSPISDNLLPSTSLVEVCPGSAFLAFMTLLNTLIRNDDKISGEHERVKPIEIPNGKYDFIVVGGGAAGAAVAARLSEISEWKILLLEAGPDEPAGAEVPSFGSQFLKGKDIWNYTTTNESYACLATNGSCVWTSGRTLGGNTAQNYMAYIRGNPTDYNNWAAEGNEGWTWDEVEPFFMKAEDNGEIDRVGRKHHGTGGPLSVERFPYMPPFGQSILDAASEAGYNMNEDLNGDEYTGFSRVQATVKNGVRCSSATAYLRPARNRKNLHVSLNSTVTRVLIENKKAVGVKYFKNGKQKSVYVNREVILSSGVVGSPCLLLLSGIGPEEHLKSVNVKVVLNLPGVGENLHDHPAASIPFSVNDTNTYDNNWKVAAEYLAVQTGPLSATGSAQMFGILASNMTKADYPDLQIYSEGYIANCAPGPVDALRSTGLRTVNMLASYLHPKSRGRITLTSNDPFELPSIWANYLSNSNDVDRMLDGVKIIMSLVDTKAFRAYNVTLADGPIEACSDYEFLSDDYWVCVIRQNNYPTYHQGGTCKMGPTSDSMAVVDPRLRVHGIKGLRVSDTSIMPTVPSGNTQAPAMMIGERAANFIKEDWIKNFAHQKFSYETKSKI